MVYSSYIINNVLLHKKSLEFSHAATREQPADNQIHLPCLYFGKIW